jgi:beta-lactamase regulating signal transducer with metallopeptidase domain
MSALLDWLLVGLVHGTALAALTALAAATVLRRARPALLSILWLIVLLKFLVPVGPRTDLSLSSAIDRALPGEAAPPPVGVAPLPAAVPAPGAVRAEPAGRSLISAGLVAAYLAGLVLVLTRRVSQVRATRRRVAGLPLADVEITGALERAAAILGLRRPPPVRIDRDAAGPYLVGVHRPILVLPAWLGPSSPAWWAAVLHELAHVKRRDPLLAAFEVAATTVFWFWPPALWARRRLDRSREMACDEWALARGPLGARDYAGFLLEIATHRGRAAQGGLALLRSRSQLAARVDHLIDGARAPALGRLRSVALAGWAALCLAGAGGAAHARAATDLECAIDPDLIAQILASNPDADADRDGALSQDEACAHQRRMRQRLLDQVVDAEMVSRLDPQADLDGDGVLSDYEVDWAKNQIDVGLAAEDSLVLEYAGERSVPFLSEEVRVASAASSARLCRAGTGCGDTATADRFPLLIDVSTTSQE